MQDTIADGTPLPRLAWVLGAGGLLPFLAATVAIWAGSPDWRQAATFALAAYGAVILSFLGAVHWGLALRAPAAEATANSARLGLGVVPALVGWAALLLPAVSGLSLLAIGVLVTWAVERAAARQGLLPASYGVLRRVLSFGAAGCLLLGAAGAWR